ncbi:hypothetical protein L1987_09853 [Smallanthus sonchifolius]|uniref:Uncharacterized protein n=1 Tax=Smallanthus sonchifolius TaxID=185202 RepID=A0ACB9JQK4_9ASTR|nr:hypothetical protein L1987_09853 [Smallanthus sonchifolius]
MADDDQEQPLTPATKPHLPPLTVDEALSIELRKQQKGFRNRTVCCGIITAVILIISVVMLVLGFTVLHVKNPKINMNSVLIIGLDRVNATELLIGNANLTVVADVSVKNTNVAAFRFEKSNSSLLYHDTVVGVADIPGGVAKARRTMRLNVTFEVMVAEITGNQWFRSDMTAGILPVESYTEIEGRVKILNIIKRKVTVTMNCSIAVGVASQQIVNQDCKKHVSI